MAVAAHRQPGDARSRSPRPAARSTCGCGRCAARRLSLPVERDPRLRQRAAAAVAAGQLPGGGQGLDTVAGVEEHLRRRRAARACAMDVTGGVTATCRCRSASRSRCRRCRRHLHAAAAGAERRRRQHPVGVGDGDRRPARTCAPPRVPANYFADRVGNAVVHVVGARRRAARRRTSYHITSSGSYSGVFPVAGLRLCRGGAAGHLQPQRAGGAMPAAPGRPPRSRPS